MWMDVRRTGATKGLNWLFLVYGRTIYVGKLVTPVVSVGHSKGGYEVLGRECCIEPANLKSSFDEPEGRQWSKVSLMWERQERPTTGANTRLEVESTA